MPSVVLPPAIPFTSQLTFVFVAPLTVPVKLIESPSATVTAVGETVTLTPGMMEMTSDADFERSATDVAVIVTSAGDGANAGAT